MVARPDSTSSADLHAMVEEIRAEAAPFFEKWEFIDREEIYHYTSLDAARQILTDRVLWASDVLSMNDTSEFKHAVSIVDDELMSRWYRLPVDFAEYFRPQKLLLIGQQWNAFAACFCSEGDLLEQWRAYTPNADGVSLGFRIASLQELGRASNDFALIKINYSSDDLRNATARICDVALKLAGSRSLVYDEAETFWTEVALVLFNSSQGTARRSHTDEIGDQSIRPAHETNPCWQDWQVCSTGSRDGLRNSRPPSLEPAAKWTREPLRRSAGVQCRESSADRAPKFLQHYDAA